MKSWATTTSRDKCSLSFPAMTKSSLSTQSPKGPYISWGNIWVWPPHWPSITALPLLQNSPLAQSRAWSHTDPVWWNQAAANSQLSLKPSTTSNKTKQIPIINHTVLKWCVSISQCVSVLGICSLQCSYFFCRSTIFFSHLNSLNYFLFSFW